jgi:hypothetical protein
MCPSEERTCRTTVSWTTHAVSIRPFGMPLLNLNACVTTTVQLYNCTTTVRTGHQYMPTLHELILTPFSILPYDKFRSVQSTTTTTTGSGDSIKINNHDIDYK